MSEAPHLIQQHRPSDSAEVALRIESVSKTFRRADGALVAALRDIDLEVERGEFICIVGPSGHGKTTLLQIVAGLLPPTKGEVWALGKRVDGPSPQRGVVFQDDTVFPWMRVARNVEYGLKCRGVDTATRRRIAQEYLRAVGLDAVARSWPRELSGGMRKRVAVATVFANGSPMLLLDEPFGSLDYVTKRQLQSVLLTLWAERDARGEGRRTILFVTHDVDEALMLADRILVIKDGIVADLFTVTLPRPRSDDDLAQPALLDLKHVILGHLGLAQPTPAQTAEETKRA